MMDYDDEDIDDVAMDSSDDDEDTICWAYQDAKAALLSEESNAVACFQRVLTMEGKKGSKTVWGFKALKHLVVAGIHAKDFDAAADRYRQLLEYSGVVPNAEMEPAIEEITALSREPKAALIICRATYDVKKPTMTWLARCITLLSDGRHTQCPVLLAEALESASTLRSIVSHATHLDDVTRQFHLLSVEAITAELRFRRRDFEEVHAMYLRHRLKSSSSNPRAVAAIYEIFAKVLLSPFSSLNLDRSDPDPHFLATSCLEKALKLYPSTDAQAHIRCWRYLTVNKTLGGTTASSNLAIPDAFKPEIDAVIRLLTLYIDDHGDQFLAAWQQARDQLADPFLQEFFDACAEAVRVFRGALQQWRHLFEAGLYSECYRPLSNLRYDDIVTMVKHEAVRDTRSLMICAAEIETSAAEGRRYSEEVMSEIFGNEYWTSRSVHAYRLAQKINSQAAAIVCQLFGENEMRSGRLNFAREQLSRAFTLYAGGDQDRRRECAVLLAFRNYFQVCRVKFRIEDDVETFLGPEQCEELKELADALRKADAQRFAQLLQNAHIRFGNFMQDLLDTLSTELSYALKAMGPAREFQASGKLDRLCTHIKNVHSMCSRTLWFDALRIQISAFVATAPAEVGRELRQIYEEGRELENCYETEVPALSILHASFSDSWGRECLSLRKFDAAERHFEIPAYASNATATDFLGASFLALTSLVNGETLSFDETVVRFDRWLTNEAKVTLRRFYDAHKSEDMVTVEAVVANLKESKDMHLGTDTSAAWNLVFDRLSHRDLHDFQLACRSFRSIACTRLRRTPFGPIVVGGHMASWRYEWGVQCDALRRDTDGAAIATVQLVDRLEETCGSSPIPKLVIRGDAPLDHPQLLEYVARHEVEELLLETDFIGLAYPPLRRFLQGWKSIGSLTVSSSKAADSVSVSDDLLRDAAASGIEEVSIRCERSAGITDEGILDFWLSATSRSLEVIRPAISRDFLRRLLESCLAFEPHTEADLIVYASPNDALRRLNRDEYINYRKAADASGSTYAFATSGFITEIKISLNEYCPIEEVAFGRQYDVLRVTRRRVGG